MYVEDLKRGTNKDIGPKGIFEMGSNKKEINALRNGPSDLEIVFDNGCDMIFKIYVRYLPFLVFVFDVEMMVIPDPNHPAN